MADLRPFQGLRPKSELAAEVAAPPYDVLNSEEAREMAAGNPHSFLRVNKPEIDLEPGADPYDERVYATGAANLRRLREEGVLFRDERPCYYLYRQRMGEHVQTGIVACASVEEYEQDKIRKHELTRPEKEDDRVRHMEALNAQVGPVFLTYPAVAAIDALVSRLTEADPVTGFTSEDGIEHTFWVVDDPATVGSIRDAFAGVEALYVADGHHRSAAATRVKQARQAANPDHRGDEPYNFFLTVTFPDTEMQILDYNRIVRDLNGLDPSAFLKQCEGGFVVTSLDDEIPPKPSLAHTFVLYVDGRWYRLVAREGRWDPDDPVDRLDVTILAKHLLQPILGIEDQRKDKRIDFVGGIRGLGELKKRVDGGEWAVAIGLHPTSVADLMAIADSGQTMPPKSTWFEPKLRSGLIIHLL